MRIVFPICVNERHVTHVALCLIPFSVTLGFNKSKGQCSLEECEEIRFMTKLFPKILNIKGIFFYGFGGERCILLHVFSLVQKNSSACHVRVSLGGWASKYLHEIIIAKA